MDRYVKVVLTVIAASLAWLCLHLGPLVPGVDAAVSDARVEIVGVSVRRHRALPVYVTGERKCRD